MFTKNTLRVATFALLVAAAASANAVVTTATFQVLITITASCTVTAGAGSNINFGSVAATATNLAGTSNISVNCSKTTPYNIGLAPVSNASTTGAGLMATTTALSTNLDKVPYQLRSTAGTGGTIWGNTASNIAVGNGVAGTGTGAAQSIPVYATVASANFTPDNYADTVTVNVNY